MSKIIGAARNMKKPESINAFWLLATDIILCTAYAMPIKIYQIIIDPASLICDMVNGYLNTFYIEDFHIRNSKPLDNSFFWLLIWYECS